MEKNHPINELMAETIQKIRETVDANTVVGEPIHAGEITLIPVSKISFGFGNSHGLKIGIISFSRIIKRRISPSGRGR